MGAAIQLSCASMKDTSMSNMKPEPNPQAIEVRNLDDVTGGCAVGGCYGGRGCTGLGGVAYTQQTGFGVDPLFMLFAMTLFSQFNKT
jgi:hypothetical protein